MPPERMCARLPTMKVTSITRISATVIHIDTRKRRESASMRSCMVPPPAESRSCKLCTETCLKQVFLTDSHHVLPNQAKVYCIRTIIPMRACVSIIKEIMRHKTHAAWLTSLLMAVANQKSHIQIQLVPSCACGAFSRCWPMYKTSMYFTVKPGYEC